MLETMQQKSDKQPAASTTTPAPRATSLRLKTGIKAGPTIGMA